MRVKIDNTIYEVVDKRGSEVCILQTFPYGDGMNHQIKIWTSDYREINSDTEFDNK